MNSLALVITALTIAFAARPPVARADSANRLSEVDDLYELSVEARPGSCRRSIARLLAELDLEHLEVYGPRPMADAELELCFPAALGAAVDAMSSVDHRETGDSPRRGVDASPPWFDRPGAAIAVLPPRAEPWLWPPQPAELECGECWLFFMIVADHPERWHWLAVAATAERDGEIAVTVARER